MPKLEVITVEWVSDEEVHIYIPGQHGTWFARPVPILRRGEVEEAWELNSLDEVEGYYDKPEDAFGAVGEKFELPIVITKERE
jgi:hypothetical protein